MALDVSNFDIKQPGWEGLYHLGDTLARTRARQDELQQQQIAKRNAAGTFLNNYLDKKDYLTGTAADGILTEQLQQAMQQGAQLASQGADNATILMALNPLVSKINDYSARAKTINKQLDDGIAKLKQNGYTGFNFEALKNKALQNAFYDSDAKTGALKLNPDKADPSTNWLSKTISDNPEDVTTANAFDRFAKNAPMNKTLSDVTMYNPGGGMSRQKVHLTGQNYLVQDVDDKGVTTGMVPAHDIATEAGQPLIHDFNGVKAPVRLLDEKRFDQMLVDNPDMAAYLTGQVKKHIGEYKNPDGTPISLNDPKAKYIARALAYDELNSRKNTSIEQAAVENKPSAAQIRLTLGDTPEYLQMIRNQSEARAEGRAAGNGTGVSAVETIGQIYNNNPDYINGNIEKVQGRNMINVTGAFPAGGLKTGKGDAFKYRQIYYDPEKRQLVVEKETTTVDPFKGRQVNIAYETVPENKAGQFMNTIAGGNGVGPEKVRQIQQQFGYSGGRFGRPADGRVVEQEQAAPPTEGFIKSGKIDDLAAFKDQPVAAGKVKSIKENSWYQKGDYTLTVETPDGEERKLTFKGRKALADYLQGGEQAPPSARPAQPPTPTTRPAPSTKKAIPGF